MASAQLSPAPRCADVHCSRFAIRYVLAEPWTHHKVCSNHLSCRRLGSHCRVCAQWSESDWDGLEALMARLAARQERPRSSGKATDHPGIMSEDSSSREGRLIIDEMPAMEVEVETSLPGKSPLGSSEPKSRASGSEMCPSGQHSGPARPSPAGGSERHKSSKSLSSLSRGASSKREGRGKHSSSASSSKKRSSTSSSHKDGKRRSKEDRSPHWSPAHSSLGTSEGSRAKAARPMPSPTKVPRTCYRTWHTSLPAGYRTGHTSFPASSRTGHACGWGPPALPLPAQWQIQLLQLQAMQQAMASVPYTFTGQHPFQPPGFGVGDMFGPPNTSQPMVPASSVAQLARPGQASGSDRDTSPPGVGGCSAVEAGRRGG